MLARANANVSSSTSRPPSPLKVGSKQMSLDLAMLSICRLAATKNPPVPMAGSKMVEWVPSSCTSIVTMLKINLINLGGVKN